MRILSIDQSFTSSGIVVLDNDSLFHAELFRSDPNHDIYQRAWSVSEHISQLIEQYKPDIVSIEGLAFSKFGNATRDLAGLQFVIITNLRFKLNMPLLVIAPNAVKKIATNQGKAKKEKLHTALPDGVKEYFKQMGALKTKGLYDLTDAYWIGIAAYKQSVDKK